VDLLDRVPDSIGLIIYTKEINAESVKVNDKDKVFKWLKNSKNQMKGSIET